MGCILSFWGTGVGSGDGVGAGGGGGGVGQITTSFILDICTSTIEGLTIDIRHKSSILDD